MGIRPFELERYFAKYEFSVPHLLCGSDCESWSIQDLLEFDPAMKDAFLGLRLGYIESPGMPGLRGEISQLYTSINPEQVLVHHGAQEIIHNFMQVMVEPGDHILAHFPSYQSLYEVARSRGVEVTFWEADSKKNWELDLDFLKDNLKENTKAVVINFPHNPTGSVMPREVLDQLIQILSERGIYLLSDEVYRFLEYDKEDRVPAACDLYPKAISVGVMSKSFGLPGLRIGWLATQDADVYQKMASHKDYTTICNTAPGEFLSELALKHRDKILNRNLSLVKKNLAEMDAFMVRHEDRFSWVKPKAGPICLVELLGDESTDRFCKRLVDEKGVLLLPASAYLTDLNHFRVGMGRASFSEASLSSKSFWQIRPGFRWYRDSGLATEFELSYFTGDAQIAD